MIDRDLYRSVRLWKPSGGRGTFGGQVIAQAAWCATLSVRRDEGHGKGLHSLHSYFLSFGNADIPIIYQVQRLRDGRSYSTRTVLATQCGVAIFTITCSFCLPEPNQVTRQFNVPSFPLLPSGAHGPGKIPDPEDCLPTEDRLWKALDGKVALSEKFRDYIQRAAEERLRSSIEMRSVDPKDFGGIVSTSRDDNPQQLIWFRSRAKVAKDPAFQKCVIAYASDFSFIGTAARACGLGATSTPRLGMLASLDHTLHFYDDTVDASDWLLFYMEAPIIRSGRGLVSGRIYKRDGTLAVSCLQEGVVRAAL